MPDIDYSLAFNLEPEKIVEYFKRKGYEISYSWQDVWKEQHHRVFTVAKAMNMDVLQTLRDSVEKSINEGITYQDFKKGLQGNLTNLGWWGSKKEVLNPNTGEVEKVTLGTPNRLRIIYETNLNVAYAVGNYEGMKANAEERPYWRYRAILDNNTRLEHKELHNKVYPHDHSFWKTYYPPNGWGCRCTVEALTFGDVEKAGYKISDSIPKTKIDNEWSFNPALKDFVPDTKNVSKDISKQYEKTVKEKPIKITKEEKKKEEPKNEVVDKQGKATVEDYNKFMNYYPIYKKKVLEAPNLNRFQEAKAKYNLTSREFASITVYTDGGWYRKFNEQLRTNPDEKTLLASKCITTSLEKLPIGAKTIYRGMSIDNSKEGIKNFLELTEPGGTYINKQVMSTTTSRTTADSFSFGDVSAIFVIKNKSGRDVSAVSVFHKEKEVLVKPNTKYKIISRKYEETFNRYTIKLEEL